MPELISHSLGQPRFYLSMLMSFAGIALVLTIAGLYGILSYAVAQRTRELGIRLALGSPRSGLVRLVTGEGLALVVAGIIIGFAGSFGLTRLMTSMLYGVSPLDVRTWMLAALSLLVPTVLATVVPALRASKADPVIAMRVE
jgi:putative ABC transport system permease protein